MQTIPFSDLEAATMYKLQGKSLNMQTGHWPVTSGQGFKNKELVCLGNLSCWYIKLISIAGTIHALYTMHIISCAMYYADFTMHTIQ